MSILNRKTATLDHNPRPDGAPDGWDDPGSPFYIPDQLRPFYEPAPWDIERDTFAAQRLAARAERADQEAAWNARTQKGTSADDRRDAVIIAAGIGTVGTITDRERPSFDRYHAAHRDDMIRASRERFEAEPEHWLALARHERALDGAAERAQRAAEEVSARDLAVRRKTCSICGEVRRTTTTRETAGYGSTAARGVYRACATCHAEVERLRADAARATLSVAAATRCAQIAADYPLQP